MMNYQSFDINEFHGGITDNYIDTTKIRYQEADNFIVTENRKLYTRNGSNIWDATNPQIPAGSQRINAFIDHRDTLLTISSKKCYYVTAGAWATLSGPTSNDVFTTGDTNSKITSSSWNDHTYVTNSDFSPVMKIYIDASNVLRVRSAGLPDLAVTPSISGIAGANSYIYGLLYYYTYTINTRTFVDYGPVTYMRIDTVAEPSGGTPINIGLTTAIPTLSNGATYNWDTTNIKVRIYRTQNEGTLLTYVGEISNGTGTYSDTSSDATIFNNATIYTSSGELSHSPPPLCKVLHVVDAFALYGHIKLPSGEILKNRVVQSMPGDPDSTYGSMYVDLDDEVVAISSVGQNPVVLCKKRIYRLDGYFLSDGTGLLQAQEIESTVGCVSANSVVQIQRGVVFAGEGGFYFTDGLEVRKLSTAFNDRYKAFTTTTEQRERIYGCFDRYTKRVWLSVQETDETDVNKHYILDSRYGLGVAGDDLEQVQVCFTTASNSSYYRPTACIFLDGIMYRGDTRGYIFKHEKGLTSDPLIDVTKTVADWDRKAIIWDYISSAQSFGTTIKRKFIPKMVFSAENETNVSVQIRSINDVGRIRYSLTPVRFRKNCTWGDAIPVWQDENAIWDFSGVIEEQRLFNSEGLRCSYKQIEITNAYVVIINSDSLCNVDVDSIAKTITLRNLSLKWPINLVGHEITLSNDNFIRKYIIAGRTDSTITVTVGQGSLPQANNLEWEISGYPKDEILNLISISMAYAYLGEAVQYDMRTAGGIAS